VGRSKRGQYATAIKLSTFTQKTITMYTEQEVTNIRNNQQEQLESIIVNVSILADHLMRYHFKAVKFSEAGLGFNIAEIIIARAYCTIHMAHMDESDFEEMLTSTLAYFATGLYDCEKISGDAHANGQDFYVSGWRYTSETHNNAGYWFDIYTFQEYQDAHKCITMLKAIGAELEKLHKN
jgi:hypothetical protein